MLTIFLYKVVMIVQTDDIIFEYCEERISIGVEDYFIGVRISHILSTRLNV